MRMSTDVGRPITKAFEGCLRPLKGQPDKFTTYYCPAGVLTLGYGHTNLAGTPPKITAGDVWSQKECDDALSIDLINCDDRVDRAVAPVKLTQNQHDALSDFDFNTGGITRSSIPAKIKAGQFDQVGDVLMRWNKANGQVLAGLTRRRLSNKFLFDGNQDQALKTAGTHRAAREERGELMPQQVDRPAPPPAEVVKRSAKEIGTVTAGAGTSTVGQTTKPFGTWGGVSLDDVAIIFGVAVVVVGVIFLFKKYNAVARDWA